MVKVLPNGKISPFEGLVTEIERELPEPVDIPVLGGVDSSIGDPRRTIGWVLPIISGDDASLMGSILGKGFN
jgi:hypothetical protein